MALRRSPRPTATLRGRPRRRQAGDERGAVLVESALVLPIILLLFLGLVEFALAYQSSASVNSATRAGIRTASAEPRQASFYTDTVNALMLSWDRTAQDTPVELWIYKADTSGLPPSGNFTTCSGACARYTWNSGTKAFVVASTATWTQNACAGTADSVGIYLKSIHKYISGFISGSVGAKQVTLTDTSVARLEPQPSRPAPSDCQG